MAFIDIINEIQATWRSMLSNCYAFRMHFDSNEANIWSVNTALGRIYHDMLPAPGSNNDKYTEAEFEALLPAAYVWICPSVGFTVDVESVSDSPDFYPRCDVKAVFLRQVANGESNPDQTMRQYMSRIMKSGDDAKPGLVELMKPSVGFSGPLEITRMQMHGPGYERIEFFPEVEGFQHVMLTASVGR